MTADKELLERLLAHAKDSRVLTIPGLQFALLGAIQRIARDGRDAAIGAQVRKLVDGGPFDLTDSPKSFVSNCQRFVRDADAALSEKGAGK